MKDVVRSPANRVSFKTLPLTAKGRTPRDGKPLTKPANPCGQLPGHPVQIDSAVELLYRIPARRMTLWFYITLRGRRCVITWGQIHAAETGSVDGKSLLPAAKPS